MRRAVAIVLSGLLVLGVGAAMLPLQNDMDGDELLWETFPSEAREREERSARVVFGKQAITKILDVHNKHRKKVSPGASNMKYVTWELTLATSAQSLTEGCIYKHTPRSQRKTKSFNYYGQNILYRGGTTLTANTPIDPADFIEDWHSEVSYYNYDTNKCLPGKQCGHYTQIVWDNSHAVGCGQKFCRSLYDTFSHRFVKNAWFVACNYGPGGNIINQKPYETGKRCSKCDEDTPFCFRGLCHRCNPQSDQDCVCSKRCKNCGTVNSASCTCSCPNGFYGPQCEKICQDTHRWCGMNPGWPNKSACNLGSFVPAGCPLMCGVCKARDRNFRCGNPNGSNAPRALFGGGTVYD